MFTDIEGSTRLARMLGGSYGAVLNAHRAVLRTALRDFDGIELFTEGDSFFVAFGDAAAAVGACVEAQRALAAHPWPSPEAAPRVRMGLHTGWATPVAEEYTSEEVHRAARVASAAHGGQVLCSEATALAAATCSPDLIPAGLAGALTGVDLLDLGPHRLRGFDDAARLFQLIAPGLERTFPRVRTPGAPVHNLPAPLTPLVGRRAEVAELTRLVGRHRLVTVAGAGGSGKTRVALAAAGELLSAYADGVWIVDASTGGGDLASTIAGALGLRREPGRALIETVIEQCATRRVLLVLDTCEVVAGAEIVRQLLAACPRLDILAAGREPLSVHGEVVWRLPPLAPADAFALLNERAAAARGGRSARPEETADLARVASRLEGVPLAIELAAARLHLLSPAQLASRLDDPLTALETTSDRVPGAGLTAVSRHDSLTDSLEWSYRRLSPAASRLLRRLAVFAGPVELSTVEWCGPGALGALSELTRKSMIDVVPGPRYRISEQVRAFAVRHLAAAGEEPAARDTHASWALHILDGVAVGTDGQPRTVSLTELAPFVGEWRTALRWAATGGDVRAGFRLAGALDPWWREQGGARNGRDLLDRLYGRADGAGIEPAELASACLVRAGLAEDRAERSRFLDRAETLARQADRPDLQVRAKAGRRVTLIEHGRHAEAEQLCRQVIGEAEQAGVAAAALPSVVALAELLWRKEALDEAAELLGGARQLEAGRPEDRGRRTVDWILGMVALRRGDLVAAHDHLVVALRSRLRHGFRGAAADAVAAIAVRCALGGDPEPAAVLFGGAESVRGARRTTVFGPFWSAQEAAVQAILGDKTFDDAYVVGAGLGFDRIVAMALAVEHPDLEHGSVRFAPTLN
jgi:predicted ATPase/class 3 adenylate cyclase